MRYSSQGVDKARYVLALAHVGDEGHALIAPARREAELREPRQQRHGHVVHAVIVHVLQYVRGEALPRPGQTGYYEKFHPLTLQDPDLRLQPDAAFFKDGLLYVLHELHDVVKGGAAAVYDEARVLF